jgi:hypothetical protein
MTPRRKPDDPDVEEVLAAIADNAARMRREAEQAALSHEALKRLAGETEGLIARLRGGSR